MFMFVVMGIMMVFMVAGLCGLGMHHGNNGGHGKEGQKTESVMHNHDEVSPCPDCPVESKPEKDNDEREGNEPRVE